MKLFIDSANLDEIRKVASWGIIDGVTTNPTLFCKTGGNFKETILEICRIVNGPVNAEIMAMETDKIVEEAREVAKWHKNIVVKIPCTFEGLKAVRTLQKFKVQTNVTLVFSPSQVLLAAKAGATYISPFVGRLDDAAKDGLVRRAAGRSAYGAQAGSSDEYRNEGGMKMIEESLRILQNYKLPSQIIVASVRSTTHVEQAAMLGAPIATVPFKILEQLIKHPLTDAGIKKFMEDWKGQRN